MIIKYLILKKDPFTTAECLLYVDMIREGFAPVFQPFSHQLTNVISYITMQLKKI